MVEIMPCPNPKCGGECRVNGFTSFSRVKHWVRCLEVCGYFGPFGDSETEAIELHNAMPRELPELRDLAAELGMSLEADGLADVAAVALKRVVDGVRAAERLEELERPWTRVEDGLPDYMVVCDLALNCGVVLERIPRYERSWSQGQSVWTGREVTHWGEHVPPRHPEAE